MLNFKSFIQEADQALHPSFDPITKKQYRTSQKIDELKRIINASGIPIDNLWITFTDYPKLGIKPVVRTAKSTPTGVFGYPVKYFIKRGSAPYADDRNFIVLFKVNGKVLEVGHDTKEENNLLNDPRVKPHNISVKDIKKKKFNAYRTIQAIFYQLYENKLFKTADKSLQDKIKKQLNALSNDATNNEITTYEEVAARLEKIFNVDNLLSSQGLNDALKYRRNDDFYNSESNNYEKIFALADVDKNQYKLNPNYVKNLIKNNKLKSAQLNAYANATFKVQDLELVVPEFYYVYKTNAFNKVNKSRNYVNLVVDITKKIANKALEENRPNKDFPIPKLPMQNEILAICKELQIDIKDVYQNFAEKSDLEAYTPAQILYLLTKSMAILSAKVNPPNIVDSGGTGMDKGNKKIPNSNWFHHRWNVILRKLGFSAVVDTKNTGRIHNGEPTQGAFLNPKSLEIVKVIHNKQGQYNNPVVSGTYWNADKGRHVLKYAPDDLKNASNRLAINASEDAKKIQGYKIKLKNIAKEFTDSLDSSYYSMIRPDSDQYVKAVFINAQKLKSLIAQFKLDFLKELKSTEKTKEIEENCPIHDITLGNKGYCEKCKNNVMPISAPWVFLNGIKKEVFGKLNAYFKHVEHNETDAWLEPIKDLVKELENLTQVFPKTKTDFDYDKLALGLKKREQPEKEKVDLIETPFELEPNFDVNIEKTEMHNLFKDLLKRLDSTNYILDNNRKVEVNDLVKEATQAINSVIKIKIYLNSESEGEEDWKSSMFKKEIKGDLHSFARRVGNRFSELMNHTHKDEWTAWYQLLKYLNNILDDHLENDTSEVKHVQVHTKPEVKEFIYPISNGLEKRSDNDFNYGKEPTKLPEPEDEETKYLKSLDDVW